MAAHNNLNRVKVTWLTKPNQEEMDQTNELAIGDEVERVGEKRLMNGMLEITMAQQTSGKKKHEIEGNTRGLGNVGIHARNKNVKNKRESLEATPIKVYEEILY